MLIKISGLPGKKSFKEYKVSSNPKTQYAYKSCFQWSDKQIEPFLTLYGGVGVGKTHLAIAAGYKLIEKYGEVVRFFSSTQLMREIQNNFSNKSYIDSKQNIIEEIKAAPVLILDDLGREYSTDWTSSIYHEIIDSRYSNELMTLITTNHSISELERIVGVPVVSRLKDAELGTFIIMEGKDMRE